MRWSNFETHEGQIISIDMDEVVTVINYPGDRADLLLKNGTIHSVIFMGEWKPEVPANTEIEDLKLENDRLKQRDAIMMSFIKSIDCTDRSCIRCALYGANRVEISKNVLKKLEEL